MIKVVRPHSIENDAAKKKQKQFYGSPCIIYKYSVKSVREAFQTIKGETVDRVQKRGGVVKNQTCPQISVWKSSKLGGVGVFGNQKVKFQKVSKSKTET